jgi:hypothetical protein
MPSFSATRIDAAFSGAIRLIARRTRSTANA